MPTQGHPSFLAQAEVVTSWDSSGQFSPQLPRVSSWHASSQCLGPEGGQCMTFVSCPAETLGVACTQYRVRKGTKKLPPSCEAPSHRRGACFSVNCILTA